MFDRSDGRFLGECGLRLLDDGATADLAYGLVPGAWGRGLATEAAAAVLAYAFEQLRLARVTAVARDENTASHNVMRKLGMGFVETRPRAGGGSVVEYAIDGAQWRRTTDVTRGDAG